MNKDDCQANGEYCPNINICRKPCLYLHIVRQLSGIKNNSLREKLGPPDISNLHKLEFPPQEKIPVNKDYKDLLSEGRQARANYIPVTIKEVRNNPNTLQRAVAAMLYADLTIKEISEIIDKSERTVRRICKQ